MDRYWISGAWMMLGVMLASCATIDQETYRHRYHLEDNELQKERGGTPLRAVHVPDMLQPETPEEAILLATNRISTVGGNGIAVDLIGFCPDGAELSPDALERFDRRINHVNLRRLNPVCRITGPDFPEEPAARRKAAETAGRAMRGRVDVLFWFDGDDAAELASLFRARAPRTVVAATADAHVITRETDGDRSGGIDGIRQAVTMPERRPQLLIGPLSEVPDDEHFILPDSESTYAQMDMALSHPRELEPWEPDNSVLSPEEQAEGWIALFDGETLDGWVIMGDNQDAFEAGDGTMRWVEPGGWWIRTHDRYENFTLRLEWRIEEGGNSGIFLRAPRTGRTSKISMEFQLLGDYGVGASAWGTGSIYAVVAPTENASRPPMEWNEVEITLDGDLLVGILNGVEVLNVDLDADPELRYRTRRGYIGLQDHGSVVEFRNIRLKPL